MRKVVVCTLLAVALTLPAAAEPLRAGLSTTESASLDFMTLYDQQGPSAQQRLDLQYFYVQVTTGAAYDQSGVTPTLDARAAGRWNLCTATYQNCSVVDVQQQTVPATAIFADPVANTVRLRLQVNDTSNATHSIDLTLSRPQGPYNPNYGFPNAWVDPATNTAFVAAPYLAFYRYGYVMAGTFDGFTAASPPLGCNTYCNYTVSNQYSRVLYASATVND